MPINNLPGVGPTNADIATAVAAPSAATIAAAVAAPSAATIAAAVAAPSAATIAAAVAAPSAATIASTVAGSVPTLGQITSTVQANAGSPFGGSWTFLGSSNPSGTNTVTFSGFASYKKYRIYASIYATDYYNVFLRINGLSTAFPYAYDARSLISNYSSAFTVDTVWASNNARLNGAQVYTGQSSYFVIDFDQANSNQWKTWSAVGGFYADVSRYASVQSSGFVRDTNPISSININCSVNFSTTTNTGMFLYGGN